MRRVAEARELRAAYPHFVAIATRWKDVDVYGHVNNAEYYSYFDTALSGYLVSEAGLDPLRSPVVGVCAESACRFHDSFGFPETIDAGLRVGELRTRAVRYELGLFKPGRDEAAASGHFVHVFVDRETMRPVPIPDGIRTALERLVPSPGRV
jgi:acyl-CoA thioester hydrolase